MQRLCCPEMLKHGGERNTEFWKRKEYISYEIYLKSILGEVFS